MRQYTVLRETAEIATIAFIDARLISKDNKLLIIDHKKVKRAHEKLAVKLGNKFYKDLDNNKVSCVLFNGRKDNTKALTDSNGRYYLVLLRKNIFSVVIEPGGGYLSLCFR